MDKKVCEQCKHAPMKNKCFSSENSESEEHLAMERTLQQEKTNESKFQFESFTLILHIVYFLNKVFQQFREFIKT